jgi:ParB family chromosome partitioning protein
MSSRRSEKPARHAKAVLDLALLDEAYGRADEQAARAEQQVSVNRASERVGREELDLDPALVRWRLKPTRRIQPEHALDLAESIAVHGLAQPIAIDKNRVLLAGGHRLFAVLVLRTAPLARPALLASHAEQLVELPAAQLREVEERMSALPHQPERLVRVNRMDVDGAAHPELALEIEIVENEKRRDYVRAEVRALATTLKAAGYSFKPGKRPSAGKAVSGQRMLELITGKSKMTIWRLLHPERRSPQPSAAEQRQARLLALIEGADRDGLLAAQRAIAERLSRLAIATT